MDAFKTAHTCLNGADIDPASCCCGLLKCQTLLCGALESEGAVEGLVGSRRGAACMPSWEHPACAEL